MKPVIGVDMREVHLFAAELVAASAATLPAVEKVSQVAGIKIKKDAQRRIRSASQYGAISGYPSSITYDVKVQFPAAVVTVVGPDKDRNQGALGNVLEYGTADTAPVPHLQPALEAESPIFERLIAEAAAGLIDRPGSIL